ncbi:MAG TPA: response regulator transcription factor [Saprospiraceae bacterium]|nr:DNA-binding response regulator [Saprospirales bacterium]HRQ29048.1 response regulator transcription factor [Saprospiraceae bacterium]
MKILYIEDEASLAKIVKESLQSRDFEVMHLPDGRQLVGHFTSFKPDLCLFDVMLPVKDGFELAKEIRTIDPDVPIIFITAKSRTKDVIEGFGAGGNDYIKKPFSLEELIVRINNLYRISKKDRIIPVEEKSIQIGNFVFWPEKLELVFEGEIRRISYRESQLLEMLANQKNELVHRKLILDTLWGDDNFFNSRNLDVYITRLRQYLKHDEKVQLLTLKAVGYRLVDR